jgi:hypothetical protein
MMLMAGGMRCSSGRNTFCGINALRSFQNFAFRHFGQCSW